MKLFNHHESCWGLTLWRSKTRNIEIWYCPAGYNIKPHNHPQENVELIYLFGSAVLHRLRNNIQQSYQPEIIWDTGKSFTILAGDFHWFNVSKLPLIFINSAKFVNGHTPKSASLDFNLLHLNK